MKDLRFISTDAEFITERERFTKKHFRKNARKLIPIYRLNGEVASAEFTSNWKELKPIFWKL